MTAGRLTLLRDKKDDAARPDTNGKGRAAKREPRPVTRPALAILGALLLMAGAEAALAVQLDRG